MIEYTEIRNSFLKRYILLPQKKKIYIKILNKIIYQLDFSQPKKKKKILVRPSQF